MSLLSFFGRSRQFENLLAENRSRMWRLAYAWCHSRHLADDIVQDALSKALKQHDQLRDPAALRGWLYSILFNCWHDQLRERKDLTDIDSVDEADLIDRASPDTDYEQNEIVRRVRREVARLPSGQREVITLVDLEECSYAEVAAILDIPIGTVMSRLSRARAALRDRLREQPAQSATLYRLNA